MIGLRPRARLAFNPTPRLSHCNLLAPCPSSCLPTRTPSALLSWQRPPLTAP